MSRNHLARSPALALCLSLALIGSAWAQPGTDEARARQHTREGNTHYEAARYDEAERAFREAYALSGRPGFLWNMAQCARLAGHRKRAIALYRRYVAAAPDGSQRQEAERWVSMLTDAEPEKPAPQPAASRSKTVHHPSKPASIPHANDSRVPAPSTTAVYENWWFWAGAGVVVTGVLTAVLWPEQSESAPHEAPAGAIRW